MKHARYILGITMICLFFGYPIILFAEDDSNRVDSAVDLTEEQPANYEDSLIKMLYPQPIIRTLDSMSISGGERGHKVTLRSNTYVPTSVSLSEDCLVGEIAVKSGITRTGAKTYDIPIITHPGNAGFTPNISLSYNSQSGNSSLGMGWHVSGLPMITRASKNIYYDGFTKGIESNKDDAFLLDGVRLIKIEATNDYILYESEQGNIKVKGHVGGTFMIYFEVFYPDGTKGIFGNVDSSYNFHYYPIVSYVDLHGNTITYEYLYNTLYNISKILYNDCSIEFNYDDYRPDPLLSYCAGNKEYEPKLLESVVTKVGQATTGKYSLKYITKYDKSVLSRIDYSTNEGSYNSLRFYYGDEEVAPGYTSTVSQLSEWYTADNPRSIIATKGKFDYFSGADGIITYPNKNPLWRHSQDRFENLYDGSEKLMIYTDLSNSFVRPISNILTGDGFVDILCADIEGKQEECIVKINNMVVGNTDRIVFNVYRSSLYAGIENFHTRTFNFNTTYTDAEGHISTQPKHYFSGDFNGDGRMEILAVSAHNPFSGSKHPSHCYIFDLLKGTTLYSGYIFPYNVEFVGMQQIDFKVAANNSDKLFVIDYDGDGKSDICLINNTGINIYTFDVSGNVLIPKAVKTNDMLKRDDIANRDVLPRDYNGDGLMDILVSPKCTDNGNDTTWELYNSKGNGSFDFSSFDCINKGSSENEGFIIQDVNGDGMSDLVKFDDKNFSTFIAKNNRFESSSLTMPFPASHANIVTSDISSHGNFTQLICLKDGKASKLSFNRDDNLETMMTGMASSLGVIERNEYGLINDIGKQTGLYMNGTDAEYPYVNVLEPLAVIAGTEKFVDDAQVDTKRFIYTNAVFHRQGLGFCGFGKITCFDNLDLYSQKIFDPYRYGILKQETSMAFDNTYEYSSSIASNKIAKINLVRKIENDFATGIISTTDFSYNDYGYVTKEVTTLDGSISITKENTYADNHVVNNGYNIGFLTASTMKITNGNASYIEKVEIPSHSLRQPDSKVFYKDGHIVESIRYNYDDKGNLIRKSIKPYTFPVFIDSLFTYDKYGRIQEIVLPTGLTTKYAYDKCGRISSITNHRGGESHYSYEGNRIKINFPDGTVRETVSTWGASSQEALFSISTVSTGQPSTTNEFDAQNRIVRKSEVRFDGTSVMTDMLYDNDGNLISQSLPHKSSPALWNRYTYDNYNRLTSIKEASGRDVTYSYNGLNTTICSDNISTTKEFNALGHLISVSDPVGKVTYDVAPDGQPNVIHVESSYNTYIRLTYDQYRRRTKLVDPSAGVTNYTYNPGGNILWEITAKGDSIHYNHDQFNRLKEKRYPEFKVSYQYNSYGDISSISADNGTSTTFSYDEFGRLSMEKETGVDGLWLQKDYTYSDGNVHSIKYSTESGELLTENYQYSNGHLIEGRVNNTIIFKLVKEDVFGHPTEVLSGDLVRKYDYDNFGFPTRRKVTTSSITYQDFSYSYDPLTRNLISRKDNTRGLTEDFDYDGLNRLTDYWNETASYTNIGNITGKSNVGSLYYANPATPNRLTGITLSNDAISLHNQNISYTSFCRPDSISENIYSAVFTYNAGLNRVKMKSQDDCTHLTRYYLGGCYEYDKSSTFSRKKLYLFGGYYKAPAVYIKTDNQAGICHILRDNLGSITHIVSAINNNKLLVERSYDAWGRLRDPDTYEPYCPDKKINLLLGRGYTGHEHLPNFGLINMNARLYDPVVSRFLSPDPYVQLPENTQSYNRYSYALNNPLKYNDPNGEFFLFTFFSALADFGENLITHKFKFSEYEWGRTKNAWKIDMGMYKGNFRQIVNKWTVGLATSMVGNFTAHAYNMSGKVDRVTDLEGMLALSGPTGESGRAFTIGHYSLGPKKYIADWRDHLFVHEYGHYMQSQRMGPLYFPVVAIPSLLSASFTSSISGMEHGQRWFEVDASTLGAKYFNRKYGMGNENYIPGSPNYFDINAFKSKDSVTSYMNPRLGRYKQGDGAIYNSHLVIWDFIL